MPLTRYIDLDEVLEQENLEIQVIPRKPVPYLAVNRQEISRTLMPVRLNFSIIDVTELI